ncbi:DUF2306 domain-containing protein [Kaarinaea lacus]
MTYTELAYMHLATILPAFLIGTYLLLNRKGTSQHRLLGKLYMLLMLVTAVTTLFMPAEVGPQFLNHFGFIHIFSLLVLYNVPSAYVAAKSSNLRVHRGNMIGLYVGGILIAGSFALMPGRMLHDWLFV